MRRAAVLFSILVPLLHVGCGDMNRTAGPVDVFAARKIPEELAAEVPAIVEACNRFAIDLFHEVAEHAENLFFSPFNISTALAMTYAGAAGETREEMARVLCIPPDQEDPHSLFGALIASLDRGSKVGGYRLCVANRLWGQAGHPFLADFIATCRDDYLAGLEELDFAADPEAARSRMNAWVAEQTAGKIEELLSRGMVHYQTRFVLTSAIYFKGDWASQFDPGLTREESFFLDDLAAVDVPTMSQREEFGHFRGDGFSVLELPYEGEDLSMILLLPDAVEGLGALEARLTYSALQAWLASLTETEVLVRLPRFEFRTKLQLERKLSEMGMPKAFDPSAADFSGIDGLRDLFIECVVHEAYVRVNEEGTEAAAATGVGGATAAREEYFWADHPFLFIIRDNMTGLILFLGHLVNPLLTS